MSHAIYPRAAVALDGVVNVGGHAHRRAPGQADGPRPQVLWASRPLNVRAGRLIGVRLKGKSLEVALVAQGTDGPRWVAADSVLTVAQAGVWARTSHFTR